MKEAIIFVVGVAVGSAATYFYLNDRYSKRAEEEIDEMREYFNEKVETAAEKGNPDVAKESRNKQDIMEYAATYIEQSTLMAPAEKEEEEVEEKSKEPRLIKSEEFINDGMYNKVALSYYVDNSVMFNEDEGEVVNDVESLIGDVIAKYDFQNSEETVIHVRNYESMTDYEIEKIFAAFS